MKAIKLPVILVACAIALFSCTKGDVIIDTPEGPHVSGTVNKDLMLSLINQVRQQGCRCGSTNMPPVGTVTWNNQLEAAAFAHADDMNQRNYFSHTGADGSSAGDRITRAGYNWRTYGENIAKGYSNEQAVVNGWIQSEGHCKNIMNGSFREMGVARSGAYWVQEFGTR